MREPIADAIVRACNALGKNHSQVALYWGYNHKLCSSRPEAARHEWRMNEFAENLIGVYSKGCNPNDAVEDIMTFY